MSEKDENRTVEEQGAEYRYQWNYALQNQHEKAFLQKKKKRSVYADSYDMRLVKAKQFIEDNIHLFLSCEDIAAYCYLSVKQLNRIFLKNEGVTLLGYLHAKKTEEAKRLLVDKAYSIKQTSVSLGFSSVYYFTRFFTKHTGMTPGEYKTYISKK